jgi:hypothetical protein
MHVQADKVPCSRCGGDEANMYPARLYGLWMAANGAREAATYSPDDHVQYTTERVHEALESVLYEFKRISDRLDKLEAEK